MRERRSFVWWMVLGLVVLEGVCREAGAIPAFTRKFDIDCSHCHTMAPALNDFGERFRSQGYRMSGLEERLPEELREQVRKEDPEDLHPAYWPLSARGIVGYQYQSRDHQDTDRGEASIQTRTSGIERFELMLGGLLSEQVNFYVTYRPSVTNATLGATEGQEGEFGFAWIRFNDLSVGQSLKFNLKIGSFELDVPVSNHRRLTLSPYPVYGYFPAGSAAADDPEATLNWAEHQLGAEAAGLAPWGLRYSLALINGTNARSDNNKSFDYYLRVAKDVSEHRVGGLVYWGTAPTDFDFTPTGDPITGTGVGNQAFYRLGIDGDLQLEPIRVLVLLVYGSDSSGLFNGSDPQTASFYGGFLEAQYDLLKEWSTTVVFRYDAIRSLEQGDATTDQKTGDLDGVSVAARYRVLETSRLALLLHGEYSHVKTKVTSVDGNDQTDNRFTVAFDLML